MKLLDLFCGAGGAAKGYSLAGFDEIVGVDHVLQPNFPFTFIQDDAIDYLKQYGKEFDLIHASPPCQAYSWAAKRWNKDYPDLIGITRQTLQETKRPYAIENVIGAILINPIRLCGTSFDLGVIRHRLFETFPFLLVEIPRCRHRGSVKTGEYVTVVGHGGDSKDCSLKTWRKAMGIDWMTKQELTQAVPPAYTEWIGKQMLCQVLNH